MYLHNLAFLIYKLSLIYIFCFPSGVVYKIILTIMRKSHISHIYEDIDYYMIDVNIYTIVTIYSKTKPPIWIAVPSFV